MTHSFVALQNYEGEIKLNEGELYLVGEESYKELKIKSLAKKEIVKELTDEESLALYKSQLKQPNK